MSIFLPAIQELRSAGKSVWGPESFRSYIQRHAMTLSDRTPRYISVDSLEVLDSDLRANDLMVFRLGSSGDTTTAFALVHSQRGIGSYFLSDDELFAGAKTTSFLPRRSYSDLLPFTILSNLSETALVNLASATGALSFALGLDEMAPTGAMATGAVVSTFDFRPTTTADVMLSHTRGQVQIDGLFLGRRDGQDQLFVIEAKKDSRSKTLANHKLLFPVLAIAERVPQDIAIVPVYVRFRQEREHLHVFVVECAYDDPRLHKSGFDTMQVRSVSHLVLPSGLG